MGCWQTPAPQASESDAPDEASRARNAFELDAPAPLLSEQLQDADSGRPLRLAKPGHWTATVQQMQANRGDLTGSATVAAVDDRDRPAALPHLPLALISTRPTALAQGRPKRVLQQVFIPPEVDEPRVLGTLDDRGEAARAVAAWTAMPSHQYFLVVLARQPARYSFLKLVDSVRAPYDDATGPVGPHYRVVLADAGREAPLPDSVLAWSGVAYVVWDDPNLDRISPAQQQALVDWIHWGGRLIVSGPDSLATLRGSFLDSVLPADGGAARALDSPALAPLQQHWSQRAAGKRPLEPLATTRPWSGIALAPRDGAAAVAGTGDLLVERPVGSGSAVVSAFQLSERDLMNWPGFDGLVNGALLRRPGRRFRVDSDSFSTGLQMSWAEPRLDQRSHDAYLTTPLRWFARDAEARANARSVAPTPIPAASWGGTPPGASVDPRWIADQPGGLGQWNEFGAVAEAARSALREAAGVRVPGAGFVVVALALYLVVLVPLNWMVFNALGRVEWAWAAAPVIALLAAVAVVRQAQLDIGFVRSQTEIALLELQADHPRGLLTRYTALYSSLATRYEVQFDDPAALAAPFPADRGGVDRGLLGLGVETVALDAAEKARLKGLPASSASTLLFHSEQMAPLSGSLRLSHPSTNAAVWQIENRTGLDLDDAVVVRRRASPGGGPAAYDACWLGALRTGTSTLLAWKPLLDGAALPFA
ncbi:MAG TPA: hypothetical protein PJ982_14230, partial [Lacipirellulaceae bacterium]|nr:hypothetical protein [Lacipirellulaceae bacterium]